MSARSKYGVDLMYRLWDSHKSRWVRRSARSIWSLKSQVERTRDAMIAEGRNPDHLTVEVVHVKVK